MGYQLKLIKYQGGILYAVTCRYSTDCKALAFYKPVKPTILMGGVRTKLRDIADRGVLASYKK